MATCLVTGATGVIGPVLVQRLVERGHQVRILLHQTNAALPAALQCVSGDIADRTALPAALQGVEVVFHLAAKLHVNDPPAALKAEYERVNVQGTRHLVEAAQAAGVQRFVFFSTIKVYGSSQPGLILDEQSPLQPDSWYAETKAQAESICLDALPSVVLRLSAVYGPHMKGNYLRLAQALRRGRFVPVGSGANRRTLVYEEDVVSAALLAAENPAAVGQTYNVTDGQIHTLAEIIKMICQALGRPAPKLSIPAEPVRIAAGLVEAALNRLGKSSPIGRGLVDKLVEDIAVSGQRLTEDLKFYPAYSMERGWQSTIAALMQYANYTT
jgi:UDP-glucose 4-epimerase